MGISNIGNGGQEATLKKRYLFKLTSNSISILANLATYFIVPRALGVSSFGNFTYANNIVTQILSFLDLRASTCFYVKLSQRQSESPIISFYGRFMIVIFAFLILVTGGLTLPFTKRILFENVDLEVVWLAVVLACLKWLTDVLIKISDAYGKTIQVEFFKSATNIFGVAALSFLWYTNTITIGIFYLQQIVVFLLIVLFVLSYLKRNHFPVPLVASISKQQSNTYRREFWHYSAPVAVYLFAAFITEIFDRYILQHFGGSFQQGLYSFSFAIANMCILFITAMSPLILREFAVAFARDDLEQAGRLYRRYAPTLYMIIAFFCCFLIINAKDVIQIVAPEYELAKIPLQIMLFYALISTYSNFNGSVIHSQNNTSFLRNIALILTPIGMLLTYSLVARSGVNLGAIGLAAKVFFIELIGILITSFIISKKLKLSMVKYVGHMVIVPVILLTIAFCIQIAFHAVGPSVLSIIKLIISGLLYGATIAVLFYNFPIFAGLKRSDIDQLRGKLTNLLAFRKGVNKNENTDI